MPCPATSTSTRLHGHVQAPRNHENALPPPFLRRFHPLFKIPAGNSNFDAPAKRTKLTAGLRDWPGDFELQEGDTPKVRPLPHPPPTISVQSTFRLLGDFILPPGITCINGLCKSLEGTYHNQRSADYPFTHSPCVKDQCTQKPRGNSSQTNGLHTILSPRPPVRRASAHNASREPSQTNGQATTLDCSPTRRPSRRRKPTASRSWHPRPPPRHTPRSPPPRPLIPAHSCWIFLVL